MRISSGGSRGGGGAAGARPSYFRKNTLKSHLNWLKFTKKSRAPPFLQILNPPLIYPSNICLGVRDAPLDIWGGGGLRVFVACKLFFTSKRKQYFFWRSTSDNFFLCFVEEIFCRMLSLFRLLCTLTPFVFSGQHIFDNKLFFCPHFQQTFFSDFCGDKLCF